eukprot:CAMPEP_0183311312 /NCGR_PEP_ID=MMETSP0160_2-20130417/36244_1 /TAXON_ID=2839 ORGANISM="Odontella Sinensis, Strain Grunow 1884" /NCGR_SAMPLE_ID=MMETSP0160_2 /ASSEMBLY_ACC=CAM_ASM_000250 /LENGTH=147 /DNA_ID=CAMNT_0025475855 /DNA_START=132 /DNA_END=575 /DNA_ORIENTATION=+
MAETAAAFLIVSVVEHVMPVAGGACCLWYALDGSQYFGLDGNDESVGMGQWCIEKEEDENNESLAAGDLWPSIGPTTSDMEVADVAFDGGMHETWARAEAFAPNGPKRKSRMNRVKLGRGRPTLTSVSAVHTTVSEVSSIGSQSRGV